jgi:hypothetical protein
MLSFREFYLEAHDSKTIDVYRGSDSSLEGFSRDRIMRLQGGGEEVYSDARSKTKSLFIRTWLQGNVEGILRMVKNHLRDDANRIYGLISYTVSPYIAKTFTTTGNVSTLNLPIKHIISSRRRLEEILGLPNDIKKRYLREGVGFNVNRLFWKISAHDTTDGESEITVFKWE